MNSRLARALPFGLLMLLTAQPASGQGAEAGLYQASAMEIAAFLELGQDGRYRYMLSYGALDERSAGRWAHDGHCVLLRSDPFKEPRFRLIEQRSLPEPVVELDLQVPAGLVPEYFDYVLHDADGAGHANQMEDGGVRFDLPESGGAVGLSLQLALFGVQSEVTQVVPGQGISLRYLFEPNDLGVVALDDTRLCPEGDGLSFERYGRGLVFQLVAPAQDEADQ